MPVDIGGILGKIPLVDAEGQTGVRFSYTQQLEQGKEVGMLSRTQVGSAALLAGLFATSGAAADVPSVLTPRACELFRKNLAVEPK